MKTNDIFAFKMLARRYAKKWRKSKLLTGVSEPHETIRVATARLLFHDFRPFCIVNYKINYKIFPDFTNSSFSLMVLLLMFTRVRVSNYKEF